MLDHISLFLMLYTKVVHVLPTTISSNPDQGAFTDRKSKWFWCPVIHFREYAVTHFRECAVTHFREYAM